MFDEDTPDKLFKIKPDDLKPIATGRGNCVASDRITVDGMPVGYMYREEPDFEEDSGWRFLAGDETDDYLNEEDTVDVHDLNVIANHDPNIVPLLDEPVGATFSRDEQGNWQRMDENE